MQEKKKGIEERREKERERERERQRMDGFHKRSKGNDWNSRNRKNILEKLESSISIRVL